MSENTIWEGSPSHMLNFKTYVACILFCWLVFPIIIMLIRMLQIKSTKYKLTNERLFIRKGIFTRKTEELELYRVKDYIFEEPFWLRMVGRSNILLQTSDASNHRIRLEGISQGKEMVNTIRGLVEQYKRTGGAPREITFIA